MMASLCTDNAEDCVKLRFRTWVAEPNSYEKGKDKKDKFINNNNSLILIFFLTILIG